MLVEGEGEDGGVRQSLTAPHPQQGSPNRGIAPPRRKAWRARGRRVAVMTVGCA